MAWLVLKGSNSDIFIFPILLNGVNTNGKNMPFSIYLKMHTFFKSRPFLEGIHCLRSKQTEKLSPFEKLVNKLGSPSILTLI